MFFTRKEAPQDKQERNRKYQAKVLAKIKREAPSKPNLGKVIIKTEPGQPSQTQPQLSFTAKKIKTEFPESNQPQETQDDLPTPKQPKQTQNPPTSTGATFRDFINEGTVRNLKTIKSFQKVFRDLSDLLLNTTLLVIGGVKYKLIEIEFYVNDYKHHLDTFATPNLLTTEQTKG